MEKTMEYFKPMDECQLMQTSGGGFAYDLGRIIRFIGISAGSGIGTTFAMVDWMVNDVINNG
jgi:ferredoxin-NADP reductase